MKLLPILCALFLSSPALAQGYVCAEGGGNPGKGAWADEVFGWMVEKGQKGPAVIIGAIALDAGDLPDNREALFKKLGAKSCTSLIINEKNADTQEIYDAITAASVVFIRGGAQERYVNWWKGTKTEQAIHAVFDKGGVIAGTSAGCAILGEVSYDSKVGSLKPTEALQNARHPHLTLTTDFLGLVPGVLFDTHFTERGRIARLPVMLAHVRDELHRDDVVGIGMDPRTALCVEPDGKATVRGEGCATMIEFNLRTRSLLFDGKPPFIVGAIYSYLPAGTKLDMKTHEVLSSSVEFIQHENVPALHNMSVDGKGNDSAVPPTGDEDKTKKPDPAKEPPIEWWLREPASRQRLTYAVNAWAHADSSVRQTVRTLAFWPGPMGLLMGPGCKAQIDDHHTLRIIESESGEPAAAVIIDTTRVDTELADWKSAIQALRFVRTQSEEDYIRLYNALHPEEFKNLSPELLKAKLEKLGDQYRADGGSRVDLLDDKLAEKALKERQPSPAILHARLHILPPGTSIDLETGDVPQYKAAKTDAK